MKLNRVLVVARLMPKSVPGCRNLKLKGLRPLHLRKEHATALRKIIRDLEELEICYRIVGRDNLKGKSGADMIVSVGGDGTFLASAHHAGDIPMMGVNPDPKISVGFFCIANTANFRKTLERIMAGKIKVVDAPLIETRIGLKRLPMLALNEALFAGRSPAETARYKLSIRGKTEEQKSSGVWIAAGPGSTAAIGSAGGKRQRITSKKLQYLVREPYPTPGRRCRYLKGILKAGEQISVTSSMGRGTIYIDGHGNSWPVPWKSKVTCKVAKKTLKVFI